MPSLQPRLAAALVAVVLTVVLVSAVPHRAAAVAPQDPNAIALRSWEEYLQSIGWPPQMAVVHAPRFLGVQTARVANEHQGSTFTFDGSRPGVRSTVTVVLDAAGKLVGKPVVQLADVLEAR
jgi:hypothetical protein